MRHGIVLVALAVMASPLISAFVGPDATRLAAIPNAQHVHVHGHAWYNTLRSTGRGSSLSPENSFSLALTAAGNAWTFTLCKADTDGDGFTNGEELGDPECVWTPGQVPARTTDISNPGEWASVPTFQAYPARQQTYSPATCVRPTAALPDRDAEGSSLRIDVTLPMGISGVEREAELAQVLEPDADAPYFRDSPFTAAACPGDRPEQLARHGHVA
jgi:hypothetical protein